MKNYPLFPHVKIEINDTNTGTQEYPQSIEITFYLYIRKKCNGVWFRKNQQDSYRISGKDDLIGLVNSLNRFLNLCFLNKETEPVVTKKGWGIDGDQRSYMESIGMQFLGDGPSAKEMEETLEKEQYEYLKSKYEN